MDDRQFLFLVSSTRRNGNAELLAHHAAGRLPPRWEQRWLHHLDMPVPPFVDVRHNGGDGRYEMPTEHLRTLLDATLAATDIVFVAPVYWYSLPAAAKLYLDHWTGWLRVPGLDFRARMAGKRLWAGAVVGLGNRAGDVLNDAPGMTAAETLFIPPA